MPTESQPANRESDSGQSSNQEAGDCVECSVSPPTSFLIHRFKPDNIMHVLHDDILPAYAVLKNMFPSIPAPFPVRLVFADGYGVMPHDDLYAELVQYGLVYNSNKLCFQNLIVGFDKPTLWYQYGFRVPQGPVPHNRTFINEIISGYVKDRVNHSSKSQITLFSRTDNRLILNEGELMVRLAREFSKSVKTVDLESHSLAEVIDAVSRSSVVVGMHGAMLATMIWMPRGGTVLELFPYAINPSHYSPYRTLANIRNLRYLSWANTIRSNTVGHADYPKEYGGLGHLPSVEQSRIMSETEVKPHLCCEDPSWLYHIYQDTVVDVEAVIQLLKTV